MPQHVDIAIVGREESANMPEIILGNLKLHENAAANVNVLTVGVI